MVLGLLDGKDSEKQTGNMGTGTLGYMEGDGGSGLTEPEALTLCLLGRQFPSKIRD